MRLIVVTDSTARWLASSICCALTLGSFAAAARTTIAVGAACHPASQPGLVGDGCHHRDLSHFWDTYYRNSTELDPGVAARLLDWAHAHADDPEGLFAAAQSVRLLPRVFRAEQAEAVNLLRRAAAAGYTPAFAEMGNVSVSGNPVKEDVPETLRWLRRGIERGDPMARGYMGLSLEDGDGVPQDLAGARDCYQKAIDGGCTQFYIALAEVCSKMGDKRACIRALEAGTNAGELNSMARLGLYKVKEQVPPDPAAGLRLIRRAAEHGVERAQFWLGLFYRDGIGMTPDATASAEWLTKSWNAGYSLAGIALADEYLLGQGVPQSRETAIKILTSADRAGDAAASYQLGVLYLNASGSKEDLTKAEELLQRAVDRGRKDAEEPLAVVKRKLGAGTSAHDSGGL